MILYKLPDYEGGFVTKSIECNSIVTRDDAGHLLNSKPVNCVKKGMNTNFGKVVDYSKNFVILKKGSELKRVKRENLNNVLVKSLDQREAEDKEEMKVSGKFNTLAGKVLVKSEREIVRDVLTDPDKVFRKGKIVSFFKTINGKEVEAKVERKGILNNTLMLKGITETNLTTSKRLMFKGVALSFKTPKVFNINQSSGGTAWNAKGGMKPNHKYIERKPAKNGDGYIYLYELPSGKKEWRDESGKSVEGENSKGSADYQVEDFKVGDIVKQDNRLGRITEASKNMLAINFSGEIKVINKKEHVEKVKQHQLMKEGDMMQYEGNDAKILRITGKAALINTADNKLKVINLEKQLEKYEPKKEKKGGADDYNISYEEQPGYKSFVDAAKQTGFGRKSDLEMVKRIETGNRLRTVRWNYNPEIQDISFTVDGVEDYPLNFMGKKYLIRDITDDGYSLEDKETGEKGLFISHKDYNAQVSKDNEMRTDLKHERVGGVNGYEIVKEPSRTFNFKPEYSDEEKERFEKRRGRRPSRWTRRKDEPLQSAEEKKRLAEAQAEQHKKNIEVLGTKDFADFEKLHKERGFEIGANRFHVAKEIEAGGRTFRIKSEFKPDKMSWETSIDGPVKKLQLGEKRLPITDIQKDKVFYHEGGDEKSITFDELKTINGKSLFEPTKESKGIVSSLDPVKIYFGNDDKDVTSGSYEIVEADEIIASHKTDGTPNKDYTISDAQNRDRSTPQSIAQINKIATNPNFDFLSDSKTAQDGAPIVDEDYNVIAGNGRGIGVQLHYNNNGEKYRNDLLKDAEKYGFSREDVEKMKQPILVRRTNVNAEEAQRLGAISNTSNMLATEEREAAKGKATRIDDATINNLADMFTKGNHETLNQYLDEIGPDIVNELLKKKIIPENEAHLYIDPKSGKMDAGHKEKVKQILTQSVLGESSQHFEKIPEAARAGTVKSLGDIFALKGKAGDLVPHLQEAVKMLAKYEAVKDNFKSPDDFVKQAANDAFEPLKGSKEGLALFELLSGTKPNEMRDKIHDYKLSMEGDMFSEGKPAAEAFDEVFKPRYAKGVNKGLGLRLRLGLRKLFFKAVDTTQLQLFPSKKNPLVNRWQNLNSEIGESGNKEKANTFYYKTVKALNEKMPTASNTEQIKGILSSIPEDEKKWLGIDEFLEKNKGRKVSKQELLDYIKTNEIEVKEVEKGNKPLPDTTGWVAKRKKEKPDEIIDDTLETLGWGNLPKETGYTNWKVYDKNGEWVGTAITSIKTKQAAIEDVAKFISRGEPTKFSQWTTPGGTNYREILFTLPKDETYFLKDRNTEKTLKTFNNYDEAYKYYNSLPKDEAFQTILQGATKRDDVFKSGHWDEPNVFAHTRVNDRTVDGKKYLHIEEVQSDWGIEGRKKGYKEENFAGWKATEGIPEDGKTVWNVWSPNGDLRGSAMGTKEEAIKQIANVGTVPDFPFKNNYQEFVMKRMLRYAAENGYDGISWVTGEQTAARYDLSKQVDIVTYDKKLQKLVAGKLRDNVIDVFQNYIEKKVTPEELVNYVGKDIADKILKSDKEYVDIQGNDLKVSPSWATNLYDKQLVNFMDKYAKKWGGKVRGIEIKTEREIKEKLWIQKIDDKIRVYKDGSGGIKYVDNGGFVSREEAIKFADEKTNGRSKVHSLPITDAMRNSVLYEGQPLFGKAKKIFIFGKKVFMKSVDTTKNILAPSKKNPLVKRWQKVESGKEQVESGQKEGLSPRQESQMPERKSQKEALKIINGELLNIRRLNNKKYQDEKIGNGVMDGVFYRDEYIQKRLYELTKPKYNSSEIDIDKVYIRNQKTSNWEISSAHTPNDTGKWYTANGIFAIPLKGGEDYIRGGWFDKDSGTSIYPRNLEDIIENPPGKPNLHGTNVNNYTVFYEGENSDKEFPDGVLIKPYKLLAVWDNNTKELIVNNIIFNEIENEPEIPSTQKYNTVAYNTLIKEKKDIEQKKAVINKEYTKDYGLAFAIVEELEQNLRFRDDPRAKIVKEYDERIKQIDNEIKSQSLKTELNAKSGAGDLGDDKRAEAQGQSKEDNDEKQVPQTETENFIHSSINEIDKELASEVVSSFNKLCEMYGVDKIKEKIFIKAFSISIPDIRKRPIAFVKRMEDGKLTLYLDAGKFRDKSDFGVRIKQQIEFGFLPKVGLTPVEIIISHEFAHILQHVNYNADYINDISKEGTASEDAHLICKYAEGNKMDEEACAFILDYAGKGNEITKRILTEFYNKQKEK